MKISDGIWQIVLKNWNEKKDNDHE